jgi:serine/threonine-protein kinase
MSSPLNPDSTEDHGANVQAEVVELMPSVDVAIGSPSKSFHVELVAGSGPSLSTETTSLLHARLRAVTILLLVVYGIILVWAVANQTAESGAFNLYRNLTIVRLMVLGGFLAVLYTRETYTQTFLRGVEYALFGVLTLFWIYGRYGAVVYDAQQANLTELLVSGREAMIGLFMLMIVHGNFIPHRWQGTAQVVLTMALAPVAVLVLFQERHPELAEQVAELLSLRNVSTNVLILVVGAFLATYSSHVLNALRADVHAAKKYGQYQLVKKIGGGGMGEVFLAEHVLIKRPCAMKLIRTESADDPTALARFEREVQATAGLTHPNIIDIYDYGHADDGTFYYVMEYLPGLSLDELIAHEGPLPPGRVIYLLRQACSALAEAHSAGLIHRDLKPGNLFVSERGGLCDYIKVLDFGLVKLTADPRAAQLTTDQVISGTPLYMPPEQAVGDRGLDGRTDLYALGAIAYHMLTGHPPFEDESPVAIMIAHASQEVTPPSQRNPDIPADLEQVVLRCLAKKPADRYDDVLALEQALANCAAATQWDAQQAALWWQEFTAESHPATVN